jgi:hypothetical protein
MGILRTLVRTSVMAAVLATGAAQAAATDRDAHLAELRAALSELNEGNGFTFELGSAEQMAPMTGFARAYQGRLEVSSIALDLFQNREEARAFAAFLIAYVGEPLQRAPRERAGVAESLATAGAVLGGIALDPGKSRNINAFDWEGMEHSGGVADGVAGVRMLAMLEKAHGCSGPLVSVLARASLAKARDPATAQLVYLARKANRDLGKTVYPPDFSCAPNT